MLDQTNQSARPGGPVGGRPKGARVGVLERLFPGLRRRRALSDLGGDERGIIIIMFALMLPFMLGFIGLGIEVGYWFHLHRNLQAAADAAAIAGAYEVIDGRSSQVGAVAQREAENNGWSLSDGTITIRNSQYNSTYPASGSFTTDDNAVEVELTMTVKRMFSGFFMSGDITINARAVGGTVTGTAEACVIALGSGNPSQAVKSAGASTNMTLDGCSIAINSTDSQALQVTSGSLSADCMYIQGTGGYTGSPTTTKCSGPKSGQPEVADPYSSIPEPTADTCDSGHTNYSLSSGSATIDEGTWCGGINVTGDTLTMNAGLYIMDQGNFKVTGGAAVIGSGVTVVLMDSTAGGNCGVFDLSGGGSIDMAAQTSGTYSGILFFRHSSCATSGSDMKLVGGASATVVGAIYAPTQEVKVSSGTTLTGSCLLIIADTVELSGSGTLGSDCSGTGVPTILVGGKGSLVE